MSAAIEKFDRGEVARTSSDRTFGLVIAAFLVLLGFGPLLRGHAVRWWAAIAGALFLLAAAAAPRMLAPLNRVWTTLGGALHRITNPIVLGIFFYVAFAPFGWILRRMGKDLLRLKFDPEASSYWLPRQPGGAAPESMTNQY